jgi:FlaA1/EpsC-like NDP-sugar epimerase
MGYTVCAFDNSEDGLFKLDQLIRSKPSGGVLKLFFGCVRDSKRLGTAMEGVSSVIHCAALKHVYLSEYNPFEAVSTNILGVQNVIAAALEANVDKVLFTSSDKAVNPSSTMGATKLLGERLIVAANHHSGSHKTRFSSVRFGNVLDTNGSVLQIFREKMVKNEPLPLTDLEMTRYFITMEEALKLCNFAFEEMEGGEVFVSKMVAMRIFDLAASVAGCKDFKYTLIGMKPGEKKYEELVTDVEGPRTKVLDDHYVVIPDTMNIMPKKIRNKLLDKYDNRPFLNRVLRSDEELVDSLSELRLIIEATGISR